ncbi:MAG: endonuclease/exonuclease/phosphatase family protein [Cyanobacteria bacterium P01_A01_bin.84]
MIFGFFILGLISLLGLLSFVSYIAWWYPLELISHFRVQYLCLSIIVTGLLLLFWWQKVIKVKALFSISLWLCLLVIILNAVEVIPWYFPHSQQINTNTEKKVRLLSFNINVQNQQYQDIVNVVEKNNPDVALFVEIDQASVDKLKPGLNKLLPYFFKSPGGGLALFSRLPIQDVRGDTLNTDNYNLLATIKINGKPVQLIGTHALIPFKRITFHVRNRQLAALAKFIKQEKNRSSYLEILI